VNNIIKFQLEKPKIENYWRSIILFGRNVATYKFALGKTLLEIMPTGKSIITLDDLAEPYARNLCEHIKTEPKQITSASSNFLNSCIKYNQGIIDKNQLIEITVKQGFNNVIDAFHNVNNEEVPELFFKKDYDSKSKKIILTDNMFKLKEIMFSKDLYSEAEARWNLVENAWKLGVSKNLIHINYDDNDKELYSIENRNKRKNVTSAKEALNGYQKGKCFYCFDDITRESKQEKSCDVDHFFPHLLSARLENINLNGIWNLVLACPCCNRWDKSSRIPVVKYLERLHRRNEYLISSHHPLRDTLMRQTGMTEDKRIEYLNYVLNQSKVYLHTDWETKAIGDEVF
jgi:hypothetical protein